MKILVLIAVLVATVPCADELIGTSVPPYPTGLESLSGNCIGSAERGVDHTCDHSIGILGDTSGVARILYGARNVGRDEHGKVVWEITDAMTHPRLPEGQALVIAACTNYGESDEAIIAAVHITDTEWYENIAWARRYEFETGKFVDQPSKSIRCYNESWGL